MGKEQEKTRSQSLVHYRRAEAVEPDPVRRLTTSLIALGIVVAALVVADTITYAIRPKREESAPIVLGLVDLSGDPEDKDRGDQKIKPEEDKPKAEPEKEEKPVEKPSPPAEIKDDKPSGKAKVDSPSNRIGIIAVPGAGAPNASYRNRGAEAREKARGKYGGSPKTENAVRLGLEWLARHQDDDGKWSRTHFNQHCKQGDKCDGVGFSPTTLDPAMTGLALLCFAASDNTHRRGKYKDNVAAGIKYLQEIQARNGCFGAFPRGLNYYMMYNQGIATLALGEICAMSGDQTLKPTLEKAVQFITRAQQFSGGWDYTDAKTGRYDTSVTGWQVMALKSAHAAGVEIPTYILYKVARFLDGATLPSGEVIYSNMAPARGRRGQGMAAVGLASSQFLGLPANSRTAKHQTVIILYHLPDWKKLEKFENATPLDSIYYWYYATIAMFQVGGKPWDKWNEHMKKAVLAQQRRGGCHHGSWDPPNNFWAKIGGRLYSTTLNILNLQIYYRYLPLYSGGALPTVDALIKTAEGKNQSDRIQAVRLLGKFDERPAHNFLVQLAHGDDHKLAMEASVVLASRNDAAAIGPLLKQLRSPDQFVRHRALRTMAPMIGQGLVPVFIESLRDEKLTVARQAAHALRQYANVSFGFEPEAPAAERETAIEKWKRWWEAQQKGAAPAEAELTWLVLTVRPEKGFVAFSTGRPGLTEPGKKYSVYRGDKYVGRINVVKVDGDIALGKVLEQYSTGDFKEGDVVKPAE